MKTISATDRATFMARAPVDGLPIGQSMATAAIVRLMNAARAAEGAAAGVRPAASRYRALHARRSEAQPR